MFLPLSSLLSSLPLFQSQLAHALQWTKETKRLFSSTNELPILLLGLKRDLRSEEDPNGIIYPQEGYRIAQEMRCDRYMECSAVSGELVHEVFEDICRTAALGTKKEGGGLSEGGCGIM
jgi:GTPase SAR1 family protein